jgi:hypothetical protein
MGDEMRGYWTGVDDGVSPIVEADQLRKQFGADAVGVAGDGVDHQLPSHRQLPSPDGVGSVGWMAGQGPYRRWRSISSEKVLSAPRTKRTTPSG